MLEPVTQEQPQVVVEFADPSAAETVVVDHLAALFRDEKSSGWFVRKAPCWRIRGLPVPGHGVAALLDGLAADGRIVGWTASIYEPETGTFGGLAGVDVAHDLFALDSRGVVDHLTRGRAGLAVGLGRREPRSAASVGPVPGRRARLVRAGRRLGEGRGSSTASRRQPSGHRALKGAARRLVTVDTRPDGALVGGPLASVTDWIVAFDGAGRQLGELTRRGELTRGLRAVLAHHVIFHWNRLGLPAAEQALLAALTREVVMGSKNEARPVDGTAVSECEADSLRKVLVDRLRAQGTVRTGRVEEAMRSVPRHLFVPGVSLEEAYADAPLYTKQDGAGASISAASQPTIVAMMLEQLQVQAGHRVLELGAGTGYNAGLLTHLAGPRGQVTTVDVDADIVEGAHLGLAAAGFDEVRVVLGDGALGYAPDAPYDRVIATVGAHGVPVAWLAQLAPRGRLVVPLRLRGSVSRSIVFEQTTPGCWRSVGSRLSTFMPLRGIADDARRIVPLSDDGSVSLQVHREQTVDQALLEGVLERARTQLWTAVWFRGPESMEWMDLYLACVLDNALSRMPVARSAVDGGLVSPQFGWGSMATVEKEQLAYLTLRQNERTTDGAKLYEVGVVGHGDAGLAERVVDAVRAWDRTLRSRHAAFELPVPRRGAARARRYAVRDRHAYPADPRRLAVTCPIRTCSPAPFRSSRGAARRADHCPSAWPNWIGSSTLPEVRPACRRWRQPPRRATWPR